MDTSKVMLALSGLILLVCLVLSITTLSTFRNAVSENEALQNDMEELASELGECVDVINGIPEAITQATETQPIVITDESVSTTSFFLRALGDRIGVYTKEGHLVKLLETDLRTLPSTDRETLKHGIEVASWGELMELIQDYEKE